MLKKLIKTKNISTSNTNVLRRDEFELTIERHDDEFVAANCKQVGTMRVAVAQFTVVLRRVAHGEALLFLHPARHRFAVGNRTCDHADCVSIGNGSQPGRDMFRLNLTQNIIFLLKTKKRFFK